MTSGESDLVDIEGEIRIERDLSVPFFDGTNSVWLPKSQIEIEPFGNGATVTMPEWLAIEKGLV